MHVHLHEMHVHFVKSTCVSNMHVHEMHVHFMEMHVHFVEMHVHFHYCVSAQAPSNPFVDLFQIRSTNGLDLFVDLT